MNRIEICFLMEEEEDQDTCRIDVPIYLGYSEQQLRNAFEQVHDPDDWKGPIRSAYDPKELSTDLVIAAVAFYTGTDCRFTLTDRGHYVVRAAGYRRGPAGDH
jgi:hypothetical protein